MVGDASMMGIPVLAGGMSRRGGGKRDEFRGFL
jgi:hypothetical protein